MTVSLYWYTAIVFTSSSKSLTVPVEQWAVLSTNKMPKSFRRCSQTWSNILCQSSHDTACPRCCAARSLDQKFGLHRNVPPHRCTRSDLDAHPAECSGQAGKVSCCLCYANRVLRNLYAWVWVLTSRASSSSIFFSIWPLATFFTILIRDFVLSQTFIKSSFLNPRTSAIFHRSISSM